MSIVAITGNHPRHAYFVQSLAETGLLAAWVKEIREPFVWQAPESISAHLKHLFEHHFSLRETVENSFFPLDQTLNDINQLEISVDKLNSEDTIRYINGFAPKLVLSYGCHKLSQEFMQHIGARFWNTHGGLSPDYRGVITHFWPSYFLEPQMTGMTLHETTNALDAGAVVMQTAAPLTKGDGLHQLAARNGLHYSQELKSKLAGIDFEKLPKGLTQKSYGKVFMSHDWRPEHLSLIYDTYEDKVVDRVLDGTLVGREPSLVSVL